MDKLDIFELLVREHEQMLQGYLMTLVRNTILAEDLAQEAFINAYQQLHTLKDKTAFAPWLRSIARNLAFRKMKQNKQEIPTDPEILKGIEDVFTPLDAHESADTWTERAKVVEQCFEKLTEMLHQTCSLFYKNNMQSKDIASELSVSLPAVLKRLERGRTLIRQCVEANLKLEEI